MTENPFPVFHFLVDWGGPKGAEVAFSEISGLAAIGNQIVDYRDELSKKCLSSKIPGITKYSNITMKRGIVEKDNYFFNWLNSTNMGKAELRDLIINLLDENHEPVMRWKVVNAFPVKVEGPGL